MVDVVVRINIIYVLLWEVYFLQEMAGALRFFSADFECWKVFFSRHLPRAVVNSSPEVNWLLDAVHQQYLDTCHPKQTNQIARLAGCSCKQLQLLYILYVWLYICFFICIYNILCVLHLYTHMHNTGMKIESRFTWNWTGGRRNIPKLEPSFSGFRRWFLTFCWRLADLNVSLGVNVGEWLWI